MHFLKLLALSSLCLLGVVSCDDMSDEPQAYPEQLYFSKEGGEAVVTVRSRSGNQKHLSWYPEGTSLNDPRVDCRGSVTDTTMRKEKLVDGGQRLYNDWYFVHDIERSKHHSRQGERQPHRKNPQCGSLNGGGI